MSKEFNGQSIFNMNNTSTWQGSIKVSDNKTTYDLKNDNNKYVLYATGDCDISNGRQYVALPANTKITPEIKTKYNLM